MLVSRLFYFYSSISIAGDSWSVVGIVTCWTCSIGLPIWFFQQIFACCTLRQLAQIWSAGSVGRFHSQQYEPRRLRNYLSPKRIHYWWYLKTNNNILQPKTKNKFALFLSRPTATWTRRKIKKKLVTTSNFLSFIYSWALATQWIRKAQPCILLPFDTTFNRFVLSQSHIRSC